MEKMKRINLRTAIFQNSIQQWKQTIGRLTSLITNDSPERLNEIAKQKKSAQFSIMDRTSASNNINPKRTKTEKYSTKKNLDCYLKSDSNYGGLKP